MNTPEKIEAAGKKKEDGNALFEARKFATASKKCEKAMKYIEYDTSFSEEENKQAKALKVACNLNNAACKLKLKDYKQAENLCTKVIELESSDAKALYRRAHVYIQLADLDLAKFDIKKALEIDPNNRSVRIHTGGVPADISICISPTVTYYHTQRTSSSVEIDRVQSTPIFCGVYRQGDSKSPKVTLPRIDHTISLMAAKLLTA